MTVMTERASTDRRKRRYYRPAGCLALACLLLGTAHAQDYGPDDLDAAFERTTMVISASSMSCYRFDLWLAVEREQQRRGLMFVRDLPEFTGMLFVYSEPRYLSMWMKNTYISLDMLFIRSDGTISSIETNTETLSLNSISAKEPLTLVLELNAGVTEALGIQAGDQLLYGNLPN